MVAHHRIVQPINAGKLVQKCHLAIRTNRNRCRRRRAAQLFLWLCRLRFWVKLSRVWKICRNFQDTDKQVAANKWIYIYSLCISTAGECHRQDTQMLGRGVTTISFKSVNVCVCSQCVCGKHADTRKERAKLVSTNGILYFMAFWRTKSKHSHTNPFERYRAARIWKLKKISIWTHQTQ